jgi:hypothetical protein
MLELADRYGMPPKMLEKYLPPSSVYELGLYYKVKADENYQKRMGEKAEAGVRKRLVKRVKRG